MVKYLRGTRFSNNDVITTSDGALAQLVTSSATGSGSVATIQSGVFYVDGFFVQVPEQSIVLDPYGSSPTYKVGLEIDDNIIDESADANLLDPAQASFNYQAPGAWRYQFNLNLAKRSLTSVDDSRFFELLRLENGVITKQVKYPIYSELEKTFARRTFDESGDYTVRPFNLTLEANTSDTSKFIAVVEPGKAYVKGFEFESIGPRRLETSRARTTQTSTDYDLAVEYGNYIYANTIVGSANGLFDTSKLEELELHCVPTSSINLTNTVTYNATFMGKARVKHFNRYDSTQYLLYLTDVALESNIITAAASSVNGNTIVFPANYSNLTNAYANVSVRVLAGNSTNDVRKIIRYDASSKTAFLDRNLTGAMGSGNTAALLYDTRDIDSMVEAVGTKTALNVRMNVSNSSKDAVGATILFDANRKSLIFPLPEAFIDAGSIDNADYVSNKFFETKTFTSNGEFALTLGAGNETFDYGSDGSFLSAVTANTNLIVLVQSLGTATNVTVGEIINLTGALGGVKRDSNVQLTIFSGANGTFTADIYARVKVNDSESASNNRRSKTVRGNAANTSLVATSSYLNGSAVIGKANVKIDSQNGHIWFTDTNDINKTPGGNNSLYIPDVYKLVKVYDSGNTAQMPSTTNAIDITSRFYLDPGQTLEYYDHSKIILKAGENPPRGQTAVFVEYYEHSAAISGYFNVDSYPAGQYANGVIPIFSTSDKTEYTLRDCIDFRPTRDIGTSSNVATYTFVGGKIPLPYESMELTYGYYLPRKDKIVATSSKEFKIINGIAAKTPDYPPDQTDAMTLYALDIPAYTVAPTDIVETAVDNRRYTMRDIANLDKRLQDVEETVALSKDERNAIDKPITYEDGVTPKEKYAIFVDNFTTFDISDTKNPDFTCSVEKGQLKPYTNVNNFRLVPATKDFTKPDFPELQKKRIWQAPESNETIINAQTAATKNIAIQPPVLTGKFEGDVQLFPSADTFFSISIPIIPITRTAVLPPRQDFLPPSPPPLSLAPPVSPPAPSGAPPPALLLPPTVIPPTPAPVLSPVTKPIPPAAPTNPPPTFVPPAAPPPYIPRPPSDPVKIQIGADAGVLPAIPTTEAVDVVVLPAPPVAGPAPPTPPPVVIQGTPVAVADVVATPLPTPITDIVGTAPKVVVLDTWFTGDSFQTDRFASLERESSITGTSTRLK